LDTNKTKKKKKKKTTRATDTILQKERYNEFFGEIYRREKDPSISEGNKRNTGFKCQRTVRKRLSGQRRWSAPT